MAILRQLKSIDTVKVDVGQSQSGAALTLLVSLRRIAKGDTRETSCNSFLLPALGSRLGRTEPERLQTSTFM
jgi:hypothetical protein